jgi:protein TonB
MSDRCLTYSLLTSLVLHGMAIVLAATLLHHRVMAKTEFFRVQLLDLTPLNGMTEPPVEKKIPPLARTAKPQASPLPLKRESVLPEPPVSPSNKDEPGKPVETKPAMPAKTEAPSVPTAARVEGGGSAAGTSSLFGRDDAGLTPGPGSGGAGGSAVAGLGRGAGIPGLPAQQAIFRTYREAKPIQTARAAYPATALRAGLESDVTLRIEIDVDGKVTTAEILKSGGAGFDDEALKAVKQSRFEPAQKDGQNIPAEFTFVYRFRLQR